MREYTVQAGDSPARIAAEYAGCPKCARDLIPANRHKAAVVYPNGYVTFKDLRVGERLNLPDKWFSKAFDELPKAYFAALPRPDGVTPSTLGDRAAGVLGDFATLDAAAASVRALASASDDKFLADVDGAADLITRSVADAGGNPEADEAAGIARAAANLARAEKPELVAAISAGTSGFEARSAMLRSLSAGLVAARKALTATHADPPAVIPASTAPTAPQPAQVQALLQADPCARENVLRVCQAQAALGISADGKYGEGTAAAMQQRVPGAPKACAPRPAWWGPAGTSNCPGAAAPSTPVQPPSSDSAAIASTGGKKISAAGVIGLGLLGAGAVGGTIYLATRRGTRKRSRRKRT